MQLSKFNATNNTNRNNSQKIPKLLSKMCSTAKQKKNFSKPENQKRVNGETKNDLSFTKNKSKNSKHNVIHKTNDTTVQCLAYSSFM